MSTANRKRVNFCPCMHCIPCTNSPLDYEKMENFKSIGLVIYNRRTGMEDEKEPSTTADNITSSIIVQNTGDQPVTTANLLQKIEKLEMSCPKCCEIYTLVHNLLKKLRALDKDVAMGICHKCIHKDPCIECKDNTQKFFQNCEAKTLNYKAQIKDWENKMKKVAEENFREWFNKRQHREELQKIRDESLKSKYESLKSRDDIKKSKDLLLHRERFIVDKHVDMHGFVRPSHNQNSERKMKQAAEPIQEPSSIDKFKTDSGLRIDLLLRRKCTRASRDLDINELIKSPLTQRSERVLPYIKWPNSSISSRDSESLTLGELPSGLMQAAKQRLQRPRENKKKSLKFPKVDEVEEPERDFSFSFPTRPLKPSNVFRDKSSSELIKDTREMLQAKTEEIRRKIQEKKLQSAAEKEAKQLAKEEKARLLEEKRQEAEEKKLAESEKELIESIERRLLKEIAAGKEQETESKAKEAQDIQETTDETKEPASGSSKKKTPSQTSFDQQKLKARTDTQMKPGETKELTGKSQEETKAFTGNPKYETKEFTGKDGTKDTSEKEETTDFTGIFKSDTKDPKAKLKISSDKEKAVERTPISSKKKGTRLSKKPVGATTIDEEKEKKTETKEKKETWTIKQLKEKKQELVKIGNGVAPNKRKALLEKGLSEILKGKNIYNRRDIGQLARLKGRVESPPLKPPKEKKKRQIQKFKLRRPSIDQKSLLVIFKRDLNAPGYKFKEKSIRNLLIHETKHKVVKDQMCQFCISSDLALEFEVRNPIKKQLTTEFIRGKKIIDGSFATADEKTEKEPKLFKVTYEAPVVNFAADSNAMKNKEKLKSTAAVHSANAEPPKPETSGVICYYLSDRSFIEKGWTMLPTEKTMRMMNVYRMRPAKPEFDWFKRNKNKRKVFYESGEPLALLDEEDRWRWFYKNGRVALDYYKAEEYNAQQRFIVYSNGEPDEGGRPRPYTQLAMFDYLGNGIVFDHAGKVRLKYNQTEGIVLDKNIGPISHWKWHALNDPPQLQQVRVDAQLAHKDPQIFSMDLEETNHESRFVDEDMIALEYDNYVKEKSKKLTQKFKPFQIRMKAMKINEHFSLKILDQASVYLIYRDGTTNIKLNIGMILDSTEIVGTDTAEVGIVSSIVERFPAKTHSLEKIQKGVTRSRCIEKWRSDRERRLKPPEPSASVDQLKAAVARPLRPPLRAVNSTNSISSNSISTPKNKTTDYSKDKYDCSKRKQKYFNL